MQHVSFSFFKIVKTVLLLCVLFSLSSCHVGRFFTYNFSDIKDYKKFPTDAVEKGEETFYFTDGTQQESGLNLPSEWYVKAERLPFEEALEESNTVAFLVIRNDSILFERYLNGYDRNSIVTSFSVIKSVVSALMGIAVEEGLVEDIDDPITKYLDYFEDPAFDKITVRHVLNMQSGIEFNESYFNPFGHAAKFYYGRQLDKYMRQLKVEREPGQYFQYRSVNTVILARIIEKTSGISLAEYMEEKLWQRMGTEFDASLSKDRKKGVAKAFAGLNGKAIDFAKFGRLYLNEGEWNGQQVVPAQWVERSANPVRGDDFYRYRRQWWHPVQRQAYVDTVTYKKPYKIYGEGEGRFVQQPSGFYSAIGHLGQYVCVIPEDNMLVIRFGKNEGKFNWTGLFSWLARHNNDGTKQ